MMEVLPRDQLITIAAYLKYDSRSLLALGCCSHFWKNITRLPFFSTFTVGKRSAEFTTLEAALPYVPKGGIIEIVNEVELMVDTLNIEQKNITIIGIKQDKARITSDTTNQRKLFQAPLMPVAVI